MKDWKITNFLSRMNGKHLIASLVLALSLANCSSKQGASAGVDDETAASEMQAEEEMMLGEGEETQSDEVAAVENENPSTDSSVSTIEAMPEGGMLSDGSPSLPVGHNSAKAWRGSLKSKYEEGMTEWTVGRGESLSLIAAAVYGKSADWKKLVELNPEISNPNVLVPGQKLRLPSADGTAQIAQETEAPKDDKEIAPVAEAQTSSQSSQTSEMTTVSNTAPAVAGTTSSESSAPGAMGVVDTTPVPPPPAAAPAAAPAPGALSSGMVQKVDMSGSKLKLRNILLGVAAFFLLLSGLIFVLSRRKAKAE